MRSRKWLMTRNPVLTQSRPGFLVGAALSSPRNFSLGNDGTGRTRRFSRPPAEYFVSFLPVSCLMWVIRFLPVLITRRWLK